jgi:hypothetical protein
MATSPFFRKGGFLGNFTVVPVNFSLDLVETASSMKVVAVQDWSITLINLTRLYCDTSVFILLI